MSHLQFPLVLKSFVRVQPPLQWKGGTLFALFKAKGSPSSCCNYRDILLGDDSGKAIGKLIRSRLLPAASALSVSTQFGGGMHGGETAFAHLYLRLIIDSCIESRLSCAVLFFDVVAAFAQMLRRIVFNLDAGDEVWLASLSAAGFSDEDIRIIYDCLCSHDWVSSMCDAVNIDIQDSSVPLDFRYAEQIFNHSWVSQEHIPNILSVTKGSGAGMPLADLVYGMAMSRVLTCLRLDIADKGLASYINCGGSMHLINDVSFVDDVAIPVAASADTIVNKSTSVVSCVCNVFRVFGMTLNFKPGKSEGIIGFYGPKSRIARIEFASNSCTVRIELGDFSSDFRFVSCYQHLGTSVGIHLHMREEVSKRCGMMRNEARNLSKNVFKQCKIPLNRKILVMQAYILSKGTFQCGTWPMLPDAQYKRFHRCILDIYKTISGNNFKKHGNGDNEAISVPALFNDDDIIYKYGFINPKTMLRLARIGLFTRIVAKSPPSLLELILAQSTLSKGWCHSLRADFAWLLPFVELKSPHPASLADWISMISPNPSQFYKKVKQHCKSPLASICTQWGTSDMLRTFAVPITCMCGLLPKAIQAHSVYMLRTHGVKADVRRYVPYTFCIVCLHEFDQRETCLNHIRYKSYRLPQ